MSALVQRIFVWLSALKYEYSDNLFRQNHFWAIEPCDLGRPTWRTSRPIPSSASLTGHCAWHQVISAKWEVAKICLYVEIYVLDIQTFGHTGWPRSYRKYILQITQPSQYRYTKLQYRFAVTSGSPSTIIHMYNTCFMPSLTYKTQKQSINHWRHNKIFSFTHK